MITTCLFLFACSNVKLSTKLYSTGKITSSLEVDLSDVSSLEKRTSIYNILNIYRAQLDKKYEENMLYYFSFVYDNDDFNQLDDATKTSYIINNNLLYLAGTTHILKQTG